MKTFPLAKGENQKLPPFLKGANENPPPCKRGKSKASPFLKGGSRGILLGIFISKSHRISYLYEHGTITLLYESTAAKVKP
jgi:hypothetical protein